MEWEWNTMMDAVVRSVRGRNPGFMLWFAAAVIALLGVGAARRAVARLRGVGAQRRTGPIQTDQRLSIKQSLRLVRGRIGHGGSEGRVGGPGLATEGRA